jgi:hypothetical protein
VAVAFQGYDATGAYTVEISRQSTVLSNAPHHFAYPMNQSAALTLSPAGTGTWYLSRRLAPGTYYVRVFDDYSAAVVAAQSGVCSTVGCRPTFDPTHPYVSWSAVVRFRL